MHSPPLAGEIKDEPLDEQAKRMARLQRAREQARIEQAAGELPIAEDEDEEEFSDDEEEDDMEEEDWGTGASRPIIVAKFVPKDRRITVAEQQEQEEEELKKRQEEEARLAQEVPSFPPFLFLPLFLLLPTYPSPFSQSFLSLVASLGSLFLTLHLA